MLADESLVFEDDKNKQKKDKTKKNSAPAFNKSNYWRICSCDEPSYLKSAWLVGPSKAVIKNKSEGVIEIDNGSGVSSNATNNSADSKTQSESYSILNSFLGLNLFLEDDNDKTEVNTVLQDNDKTEVNTVTQDDDKTEVNTAPQNNTSGGSGMIVRVGIKGNGFTEWSIQIKQHVDRVKGLIKIGSFKEAYELASNKLDSDGIVINKAETYIIKKDNAEGINKIFPPFIGHCRYAIQAGTLGKSGQTDANLKIFLAVAPINAATKKPEDDCVFEQAYNVSGNVTDGSIGLAIAKIVHASRDSADDKDSFINSLFKSGKSDKDSESSAVEYINDFLKNAFRTPGDHTMYSNFIAIKQYISNLLNDKLLEESSYTLGGSVVSETDIPSQFNNWLIWY